MGKRDKMRSEWQGTKANKRRRMKEGMERELWEEEDISHEKKRKKKTVQDNGEGEVEVLVQGRRKESI